MAALPIFSPLHPGCLEDCASVSLQPTPTFLPPPPFPSHPFPPLLPFLPGNQTRTAAEPPIAALQWGQGELCFIQPAVKLLQQEDPAHPNLLPPHLIPPPPPPTPSSSLCSCVLVPLQSIDSSSDALLHHHSHTPLTLLLQPSISHLKTKKQKQKKPLSPMCTKLQSSAFFSLGTLEVKKTERREEMSRTGGALVHHTTGCLPIKGESLCYWRAAEPIRNRVQAKKLVGKRMEGKKTKIAAVCVVFFPLPEQIPISLLYFSLGVRVRVWVCVCVVSFSGAEQKVCVHGSVWFISSLALEVGESKRRLILSLPVSKCVGVCGRKKGSSSAARGASCTEGKQPHPPLTCLFLLPTSLCGLRKLFFFIF